MPDLNIGQLQATTINFYSKQIADNVTAHNALLMFLMKGGNVKTFDGGEFIYEVLKYAENTNAGSYTDADQFATDAQNNIDAAKFRWAQYYSALPVTGRTELTNSGNERIHNLVKAQVEVAEDSLKNLINRHLYLDGTGNSGKNLTGLEAAVPLAPTNVYGSINRNTVAGTFWKNQKFQATVDGTGAATSSTIQNYWNTFYRRMVRGTDKPNVVIAGDTIYGIFEASLDVIQRVTNSEVASSGFVNIEFKGIPVINDTTVSGIAATDAYFLNTKYLHWRPHKDRNFVALDDRTAVNQDLKVKTLVFAGNLTCSNSSLQGRYSNT